VVVSVDGLPIGENNTNMFGVGVSVIKSSWALVTGKLFIF
jgi:hypothetical protein